MFHHLAVFPLALREPIFGVSAIGNVDAHAHQTRMALEPDVPAPEKVRHGGAILGHERRLNGRFSVSKGFRDPLFHPRLVVIREEVARVHPGDLFPGIPGDRFEVPVPAQEAPLCIAEIEDAGHAFDHRIGEQLFVTHSLLRLAACLVPRQVVES